MPEYSSPLDFGSILNHRYRIIYQLGSGGFGRTYLAEDTLRDSEKCVLKEFAPQVESPAELHKAEELFEREAGILKKLRHDQIPKFRKLLRLNADGKDSLFLVQDYIEGKNYWELVQHQRFSESEVTQLLLDLLPVLEYIHSLNLIHRDLSPDNLIQREIDGKPVLIDFGCVKIAANAVSGVPGLVTIVGKKGYAPEEQMLYGQAFPHSDLYALAATILVLLTGKSPHELYDSDWHVWRWQDEISSGLAKVLEKMLAYRPGDRYQSAREVRQALERQQSSLSSRILSGMRTLIVAPTYTQPIQNSVGREDNSQFKPVPSINNAPRKRLSIRPKFSRVKNKLATQRHQMLNFRQRNFSAFKRVALISTGVVLLPAIISFAGVKVLTLLPKLSVPMTTTEQNKQQQIYERIQAIGMNEGAFYEQVDNLFYSQYPNLKGIQLTDSLEHQKFRETWYQIADDLLSNLERE